MKRNFISILDWTSDEIKKNIEFSSEFKNVFLLILNNFTTKKSTNKPKRKFEFNYIISPKGFVFLFKFVFMFPGLLIGGTAIPLIALFSIGDGNIIEGLMKVYNNNPEKFNVIGTRDSVMPFEVLFTGLIINQIYFWCMNQTIIQRALGAKSLIEAQKGLLFTGILKIMIPFIIVLPGVIGYYYFGDSLYENQDMIYPELIK